MRVLRKLPPVVVRDNLAAVVFAAFGIGQILAVVADREHELVGHKTFFDQLERERICHLECHNSCLFGCIGCLQHLSLAETFARGAIGLYLCHAAGLIAPGVIDQELCILSEKPVE